MTGRIGNSSTFLRGLSGLSLKVLKTLLTTGCRQGKKRVELSLEFKRNFIDTLVIEHQLCKQKGNLLGRNYRVCLNYSIRGSVGHLQSKYDLSCLLYFGLHCEMVCKQRKYIPFRSNYTKRWALGLHNMHTSHKQAFSPNPKLKHQ